VPGQPLAAAQEGGLVGLDGEQVVRLLDGDQEVRSLGVGLERVGGDHHTGQVQALKQRLEAGHLAGAPSTSRWASTLRVVCSMAANSWTCRPPRRAPPSVLPSTATARRRWSGWSRSASQAPITPASASGSRRARVRRMVASQGTTQWAGGVPAGAKRLADRLGGIRGPLGDRGHRPCAGQHRGSGHGQDRDQRVTAATLGAWVGDNRQVGQQVTGLGHLQRDGIGKLGESRWDRG
jgi:hypothetical protein